VNLDKLTLAQARTLLEEKYSRIFVAPPLITIRLADEEVGEWGYITVLGLVRSPGRLAVASIAGMNLSDALHEAGGFDQSANMQSVVVTRKTDDQQLVQCECDMTKLGRTGSGEYDLVLFDGDIVYVPERLF
jgi:protein involved in polysaccharide export with SLBB domain